MDPATSPPSTRDKLLEAAAAVFLQHGTGAASMDLVRQQAGVSNGSLYHHFPTKTQLADALYAHILRDFHAAMTAPIGPRTGAEAGVKGVVRAYIGWVVTHPDRARLLHVLKRGGQLSEDGEWNATNAKVFGALRDWIANRVEAGEMRAVPFHLWMPLVFAPAFSLTAYWVKQPEPAVPAKSRAALEHAAWMAVAP